MARRTRHQTARDYPRTARLNRLFREILAEELERLDEEGLERVTITEVDCDNDLGRAVVYFDSAAGPESDADVLESLEEVRLRLQGAIARQARVKRTPELVFRPDDVLRGAERVEQVLRELRPEG